MAHLTKELLFRLALAGHGLVKLVYCAAAGGLSQPVPEGMGTEQPGRQAVWQVLGVRPGQTLNVYQNALGIKTLKQPLGVLKFGAEQLHQIRLLLLERLFQCLFAAAGGQHQIGAAFQLAALGLSGEKFRAGVAELDEVMRLLTEVLGTPNAVADLKIVRGLDYYTGTVFETLVYGYEGIGSICSGGRYENLAGNYSPQSLPGVGGSIGLTRLFYVLQDCGAVKATEMKAVEVCVLPMAPELYGAAAKVAEQLRAQGRSVDLVLSGKRLGDQLRYAAKVAEFALVVGENEVKSGKFGLKNLQTGETTEIELG